MYVYVHVYYRSHNTHLLKHYQARGSWLFQYWSWMSPNLCHQMACWQSASHTEWPPGSTCRTRALCRAFPGPFLVRHRVGCHSMWPALSSCGWSWRTQSRQFLDRCCRQLVCSLASGHDGKFCSIREWNRKWYCRLYSLVSYLVHVRCGLSNLPEHCAWFFFW